MTSKESRLAMSSFSTSESTAAVTTSSSDIVVVKGRKYLQRQLGPAPFASFEDLSDELDSPPETARITLPGIKEDPSSQIPSPSSPLPSVTNAYMTEKEEQGLKDALKSSLEAAVPPRIDISRASSSSQHEDSITSSPERENGARNLGYKEDGTVDLRSSTEELDYIQEPGTVEESEEKRKRERIMKRQQQVRNFGDTQSQHELIERKDSNCSVISDVGLLCLSGRTSRLSSIGSAASGGSVASGGSHLSVGSHMSGRSTRSPSPHKMLLETSFCGSKPMLSQGNEQEISSAPASISESSAFRPPSRLRSRSPSPHKMLLETSFCGTKQIVAVEKKQECNSLSPKKPKKNKQKSTSSIVTEAEIALPKPRLSVQAVPISVQEKTKAEKEEACEKQEKPKPKTLKGINKMENVVDIIGVESKNKAANQPQHEKKPVRPKKIISLRDLPVDEIYIPLTGPEVDFEEIIRKTSPNVKNKSEKPQSTANEIFIPLCSPTKSSSEKNLTQIQAKKPPAQKLPETLKGDLHHKPQTEKEMKGYEICEDGSIFIPLHSPDEEKSKKKLESFRTEEIKAMTTQEQLEDKQSKSYALESLEAEVKKLTHPLQSLASGKSEMTSGGSRTPSPGSSLSRKSSFASLFKKSEALGSPDLHLPSQIRKKSGTLSNVVKDSNDGLWEKCHSLSKGKERQPSTAHSPSGKKNVFANLFSKKKIDVKSSAGKKTDDYSKGLDQHCAFNSEVESRKTSNEGDYIIIPLKDPTDPVVSLDSEEAKILVENTERTERPVSPLVILERSESPKAIKRKSEEMHTEYKAETLSEEDSPNKDKEVLIHDEIKITSENKSVLQGTECSIGSEKQITLPITEESEFPTPTFLNNGAKEHDEKEQISTLESVDSPDIAGNGEEPDNYFFKIKQSDQNTLEFINSLDADMSSNKREIMTVSADGVRKLKLPPEPGDLEEDHERKGLVNQESFEDELPYVPTTLPQERTLGVPIVPIKQRMSEIKTCPIERPRSTTPINPTTIEDFVSSKESVFVSEDEKMKISLPKDESGSSKSKSPRKFSAKGKSWFEFAEAGLQYPRDYRKNSLKTSPSPPPLPPRSSPPSVLSSSAPPTTTSWINFEQLPEKRKQPKRITTVPSLRSSIDGSNLSEKNCTSKSGNVKYNYVSPEDCQCECHDHNSSSHSKENDLKKGTKDKLKLKLEFSGEIAIKDPAKNHNTNSPLGENEISECKYCENGRSHMDFERDIEETPLLDTNSDGENDSSSKKDGDLSSCEMIDEKISHSSDLPYACGVRHEETAMTDNFVPRFLDVKPFGMDLSVDSHSSSLISQDDLQSPSEINNDLHKEQL